MIIRQNDKFRPKAGPNFRNIQFDKMIIRQNDNFSETVQKMTAPQHELWIGIGERPYREFSTKVDDQLWTEIWKYSRNGNHQISVAWRVLSGVRELTQSLSNFWTIWRWKGTLKITIFIPRNNQNVTENCPLSCRIPVFQTTFRPAFFLTEVPKSSLEVPYCSSCVS